jgi:hypothetical protein
MSTLSLSAVPVNGSNLNALDALEAWMLEQDYSGRCRSDARRIVSRTGDVAACYPSCLDSEHIGIATEVYIDALPALELDDERWDNPASYMTVDDLMDAAAARRVPRSAAIVPPELTDADFDADWPGEPPFRPLGSRLTAEELAARAASHATSNRRRARIQD